MNLFKAPRFTILCYSYIYTTEIFVINHVIQPLRVRSALSSFNVRPWYRTSLVPFSLVLSKRPTTVLHSDNQEASGEESSDWLRNEPLVPGAFRGDENGREVRRMNIVRISNVSRSGSGWVTGISIRSTGERTRLSRNVLVLTSTRTCTGNGRSAIATGNGHRRHYRPQRTCPRSLFSRFQLSTSSLPAPDDDDEEEAFARSIVDLPSL